MSTGRVILIAALSVSPLQRQQTVSLPPSPPAEKATARQDQARQASTGDGSGDRVDAACNPLQQSPSQSTS
jgi:hypothetical protein